jgi:hypothetical protein
MHAPIRVREPKGHIFLGRTKVALLGLIERAAHKCHTRLNVWKHPYLRVNLQWIEEWAGESKDLVLYDMQNWGSR